MTKLKVTYVLDETGSMERVRDDTIGGFNAYLDELRARPGEIGFTLLKFDSNRVEKVHVGVPVADVPHLTRETYRPGAWTPLYDAVGKAVHATAAVAAGEPEAKVLVVVHTDGHENASREFSKADIVDLIKAKTAAGWEFAYLGCGFDAYGDAASIGIPGQNTMSYGAANTRQAFAAVAAATLDMARSPVGDFQGFDASQKAAAGDVFDPAAKAAAQLAPDPAARAQRRKGVVEDIDLTKTTPPPVALP